MSEAKQQAGYTLSDALGEIEIARKNRGAEVGLFVFSARTCPEGLEPLARYGNDVVVVWDAEDSHSDIALVAGLSVARAICAQHQVKREGEAADFEAIDRAILEIEKQVGGLDEITKYAHTIKGSSEKILKRSGLMHAALDDQLQLLTEKVRDLKNSLGDTGEEHGGVE